MHLICKAITVLFILNLGTITSAKPNRKADCQDALFTCPEGTFVKQMAWSTSNQLTTGLELHCYEPRSLTARTVIRTHGSGSLPQVKSCVAMASMDIWWGDQYSEDIDPICHQQQREITPNGKIWHYCGDGRGLTGVTMDIDNAGHWTCGGIWCEDVAQIESTCRPSDKQNALFICDAGSSSSPVKCSTTKTVGYGFTKSSSQEHSTERTFYEAFGFKMESAGPGLSTNFRDNLGQSQTTGYNWASTHESTFREEVSINVEVEAPAGCVTQVTEIIGECAFMQVRPNYFVREDICRNAKFTTEEVIPNEFEPNFKFVSKIPEEVFKHLNHVQ